MNYADVKAWPMVEAMKLVERFKKMPPQKGYVLFETGYGPSGLPHIGTFGEVARTSMVRYAFSVISDIPTRLYAVSDDMDGLRKVPDNIPNQEMVAKHLGKPLTSVPDPFGTHESFGHHMNARLREFLDRFGFEYEFKSATECYRSGLYDEALLKVLKHYDQIMEIMLPTLGEERQTTYSPFLPVSPVSGKVLLAPVVDRNLEKGTITYIEEDGSQLEVPVTGGHCKLQWKPDLGMRWAALDVDFEMYGKDHLASAPLYSKICETIGGIAPEQFCYELFLDDKGQKISKSKGNGLTIDEWLCYAPKESLSYYMYQAPSRAKRLYFDVIPKAMDEYLQFLSKAPQQTDGERLENPAWYIHHGKIPQEQVPISFNLLLNLASACNPDSPEILWGFIRRYAPAVNPENSPILAGMVTYALNYYEDFIRAHKSFRVPSQKELAAIKDLRLKLSELPLNTPADQLQNEVFAIGKIHAFENLRDWFGALYEILLGQKEGPRMGGFIALYGVDNMIKLIDSKIN